MANRADYRTRLNDKFVGFEDEGYGDFEFTDLELNTYLELAVARLFPAVFKRVALTSQALTSYGHMRQGYCTTAFADRVFMVEDAASFEVLGGWQVRPDKIIGLDGAIHAAVNIYYTDAYAMPADDSTDLGLPDLYTPLVVLGGVIEALESRHDTGVRGDPPPTGTHYETQLIDRMVPRYDKLKSELAMSLPGIIL